MDREQVGDVTDYWEIDGYCWYGPSGTEKTFAFSPWQELGADDLHRSLKTAPILETEYHCIPWDYWGKVNPDHIKACFWAPAVHGVDGFMIWIWQRPGYNGCTANGIDEHADRLHAYSTASLDLRRLAKYVTAIPTQSGQVAILVSNASLINQDNQWNTLMDAYRGLFWLNTPPTDFITERQIARGKLAQYKVLVVHNSPYLPEETFQSIQEFARQGGTVVVTLDAGRSDPYGKPLPVTALTGVSVRDLDTPFKSAALDLAAEEIFADRQPILTAATREKRVSPTTARILGRHAGVPVLTVNPLGKGRVYYLGVDLTMDGWTRFFDRVFVAAKVQTGHLRLADDRNQPITGVEHREATVDGKRVVYLMNMLTQPSRVALPKPAGAGWFDLIRNRPLNTPALTADPLVPHLLMDR